ncbi:MAG: tetratricopeptide (TPR) repeat protein [Planctomycetota bacterium]|jgi:tetratricopeptide (TPR) repeat protein
MSVMFTLAFSVLGSISTGTGHLPQDPAGAAPIDETRTLSLTSESSNRIEGKGPAQMAAYECKFMGTLHIWTESELSLYLHVEDTATSTVLARRVSDGLGSDTHVEVMVQAGDWLAITVAVEENGPVGSAELHLYAAPESEATLAAAELVRHGLTDVRELEREGDLEGARGVLAELLDHLQSIPGASTSEAISGVFWDIGVRARDLADLELARVAWNIALQHAERTLPPGHPSVLVNRSNLAVTIGQLGDPSGACELIETVVKALERIRPKDHVKVLTAKLNLGSMRAESGELDRAREWLESVIDTAGVGPLAEHPTVIAAKTGLAGILAETGYLGRARELLAAVLVVSKRDLPADHPDTILVQQNLAATLELMGHYSAALVNFEAIHDWARRNLPEDHPRAILASQGLAAIMIAMGDAVGARGLCATVLEASQRTLPAGHPNLIRAHLNMASTLLSLGEHEAALVMLESALGEGEQSLPEGHPDWLTIKITRAATLAAGGDLERARAIEEEVLAAQERDLPEGHPHLLKARSRLAVTCMQMGDLVEAEALEGGVLEALERAAPRGHTDVLRARNNLAFTRLQGGQVERARELVAAQVEGMKAHALASLALAPRAVGESLRTNEKWLAGLLRLTRTGDPEQRAAVFELQETMRLVVLEAARALRHSDAPDVKAAMGEALVARTKLHEWISSSADVAPARRDRELTRLTLERDRLERIASRRLAETGVTVQPVELDALAGSLGTKAVALAYRGTGEWVRNKDGGWRSEERLVAHLLRPDRTLIRFELGPTAEVVALVEAWRPEIGVTLTRGIAAPGGTERREAGSAITLRERLLDPILKETWWGDRQDPCLCRRRRLPGAARRATLRRRPCRRPLEHFERGVVRQIDRARFAPRGRAEPARPRRRQLRRRWNDRALRPGGEFSGPSADGHRSCRGDGTVRGHLRQERAEPQRRSSDEGSVVRTRPRQELCAPGDARGRPSING